MFVQKRNKKSIDHYIFISAFIVVNSYKSVLGKWALPQKRSQCMNDENVKLFVCK